MHPPDLQLGGHVAGQRLDSFGVAALAEDVIVQGIAAASVRLRGENQPAVLALVAFDVEAAIHRDDADGLLLARLRHDGHVAHAAPGGKLFVEIFDAVNLVGGIDGERDSVERFATDYAGEALRMVRLTRGPENSLEDWLQTHGTLFQRIEVVFLAVGLSVEGVEGLTLQIDLTLLAGEASDVVDLVHCRAAVVFANYAVATFDADPVRIRILNVVHRLYQQIGQSVNGFFWSMIAVMLVRCAGYHAVIRAVDAPRVDVRRVEGIVGSAGHLTGGTWIYWFVD